MALGKKTGGRDFVKGIGGPGRPKGSPEILAVKKLTITETELTIHRLVMMTLKELNQLINNNNSTSLEIMIARICIEAIRKGDQSRLDFLFNRTIGKVKDTIDLNANVTSFHAQVVEMCEEIEVSNKPKLEGG